MKTKKYVLTDKVETHFMGQRVRDRKTPIELTESQARHELMIGNIELYVAPKAAPAKKD